ncbi:MAG TPA: hypothetical protein VD861_14435 [Pyrinomonadaceae bacterium]|nr:hypothetical protein [Pyrinomonadaceae bacterium]
MRVTYPDGSNRTFEPLGGAHPRGSFGDFYYDTHPDGSRFYCQAECVACQPLMKNTAPTYQARTYYSTDGTYQRLEIKYSAPDANGFRQMSWTFYFVDGGRVTNDPSLTGNTGTQRVYDRNNHYTDRLNITYNNHPATKIVDELGRYIIIESGATAGTDYIHVKGPGNVAVKWTIISETIYVNKTITNGIGMTQNINAGIGVIDRIILPTQAGSLAYVFEYNGGATNDYPNGGSVNPSVGWGELTAVTLPSGARADYEYKMDNVHSTDPWLVIQNHPVRKDLTYLQEYDGAATPATEGWLYSFSLAARPQLSRG